MERLVLVRSCHRDGSQPSNTTTPETATPSTTLVETTVLLSSADALVDELLSESLNSTGSTAKCIDIPVDTLSSAAVVDVLKVSAVQCHQQRVSLSCVVVNDGVRADGPIHTAHTTFSDAVAAGGEVSVVARCAITIPQKGAVLCLSLFKAPNANDSSVFGALFTEHWKLVDEHVTQMQLSRAKLIKDAAIDDLLQMDDTIEKLKRMQAPARSIAPPSKKPDAEVEGLRRRVASLEREWQSQVQQVQGMAEGRRREREAELQKKRTQSAKSITVKRSSVVSRTVSPARGDPARRTSSTSTRTVNTPTSRTAKTPTACGPFTSLRSPTPEKSAVARKPSPLRPTASRDLTSLPAARASTPTRSSLTPKQAPTGLTRQESPSNRRNTPPPPPKRPLNGTPTPAARDNGKSLENAERKLRILEFGSRDREAKGVTPLTTGRSARSSTSTAANGFSTPNRSASRGKDGFIGRTPEEIQAAALRRVH